MVGSKNISTRGKTSGIHSVGDGIEPFPVFSSSCKDVIQIQKIKERKIIVSAREYYLVSSCPLLSSRLFWLRHLVFFLHVGGLRISQIFRG
jgi:hypothetical protein